MEDNILVTGGTGFIGSHTCISLLENKFNLTIVDSNINSSPLSIKNVKKFWEGNIFDLERKIIFEKGDIRDKNFINKVFLNAEERDNPIKAVIHFAGLKAVRSRRRTHFYIGIIMFWVH